MVVGPLSGVRVLDLSRVLAGPWCAMLLGDAGADVIKVEPPQGDDTRQWGPPYAGSESAYFLSCNKNKRGIAADLSRPEGQAVVRRLAARADILVENFKPGTMEKWGLSYEEVLSRLNPGLIYVNISGFGRDGPKKDLPGYDFVVQAMSGIMAITGEPAGEPMKVGVAISDITTGMMAAFGCLAALHHRRETGRGQRVDLSLFEISVSWLANVAAAHLVSGREPQRYGNAHATVVPYQLLRARDQAFVVAVGNDRQFQRFCRLLGRPELAEDERFRTNPQRVVNRDALIPLLQEALRQRDAAEWLAAMAAAGIPGGPVNSVSQVFADEQTIARRMVEEVDHPAAGRVRLVGLPVKWGATPGAIRRPPPLLGQHTREVLLEAGYAPAEVEALIAAGVVVAAGP